MRIIVFVALLLTGCQLWGGDLPTYDPGAFCSLAQLRPTILHVDPSADPSTWVDGPAGPTYLEWPKGFRLSGTRNGATVVDPDGNVVATNAEWLTDVGGGASERGEDWFAVCIIEGRHYTTVEP